MKDLPFLMALSPFLAAWASSLYLQVSFERVFSLVWVVIAAAGLVWLSFKFIAWNENDDGPLQSFYVNAYPVLFIFDLVMMALIFEYPSIHGITVIAVAVLSYHCAMIRVNKFKGAQKNMMITVQSADGDFQNTNVYHNKGTEIWCLCLDKDNHGMLMRRVTQNKKGEGHVTLESGAKSAKLFEWDGNKGILDSGDKRGEYSYQFPEYGVPINASVLGEVKF